MSTAIETIMPALIAVVKELPIGTNLGLLHLLWMMVTGKGLPSRGALFPGLQASGLGPNSISRAWGAFRYGAWQIGDLLSGWSDYVQAQGHWQASEYEGFRVKAVDITAFFRPTLQKCPTKHYDGQAGKALPAIPIGLVAVAKVSDKTRFRCLPVATSGSATGHRNHYCFGLWTRTETGQGIVYLPRS